MSDLQTKIWNHTNNVNEVFDIQYSATGNAQTCLTMKPLTQLAPLHETQTLSFGSSGGVIGDPIVVPIHGRVYSLPCDSHVYRYLGDRAGRVVVNVQHELSDNLTIQEIDAYCAKVPQAESYAETLKATTNVPPYAFPRYVYIAVVTTR